jgi:hypothetical protein
MMGMSRDETGSIRNGNSITRKNELRSLWICNVELCLYYGKERCGDQTGWKTGLMLHVIKLNSFKDMNHNESSRERGGRRS